MISYVHLVLGFSNFDGYATYPGLDVTRASLMSPNTDTVFRQWGMFNDKLDFFESVSKHVCEISSTCMTGDNSHLYSYASNASLISYIHTQKTGVPNHKWVPEAGSSQYPNNPWLTLPTYGFPGSKVVYTVINVYFIPSALCKEQCDAIDSCGGFQIFGSECRILQLRIEHASDGRTTYLKLPRTSKEESV